MQKFLCRLSKKSREWFALTHSRLRRPKGSSSPLTACQSRKGHLLTFMTSRLAPKAAFSTNLFHHAPDQSQRASVVPLRAGSKIDSSRDFASLGFMLPARKGASLRLQAISSLVLIAIVALSFQYQFDGVSGSGIASVGKIKAKTIKSQFADGLELGPAGTQEDELKTLDRTFLTTDYKQNLSVWPVVATKSSRSPPFPSSR
jgi:hypothetical protein